MKTQIDLRSAGAGLIIGVLATFCIGAATSSGPLGRYQVCLSGIEGQPGCVAGAVIDTSTGQVWLRTRLYGGVEQAAWMAPKNITPEKEDLK